MAVSEEIMELVRVLDEEGFGILAGELLAEVSAGRAGDPDSTGEVEELPAEFEAVSAPPAIQVEDAIRFLRLRLIEPARHLAEAERIAGQMQGCESVEILFADEEAFELARLPRGEAPARREIADRLDAVIERIRNAPR
jgi:hypothetical protein